MTLALANWQLNRAHEKEALAARLEARAKDAPARVTAGAMSAQNFEWRRVTAQGRFEPRHGVLIDNRIHRGVAGYHVIMPLEIASAGGGTRGGGSRYVLVNRGWVAGVPGRVRLPEIKTPEGAVVVTGLALMPGRRFLELSAQTVTGNVWQNLTIERYRDAFPIAVEPLVIQQESPLDDGLARDWEPPDVGISKHYGYAFQWLALALTIAVFYLVTHVRRVAEKA